MAVEPNLLERSRTTDRAYIDRMDFILSLDLLHGCAQSCQGCFVDKKKELKDTRQMLEQAHRVARELSLRDLRLREIVVGPTDFFSATNTENILTMPLFQELLHFHPQAHLTVPCIFSPLNRVRFAEIFHLLDNPAYFRPNLSLEFFVLLDVEKLLRQDEAYMRDNLWVIDFFKRQTPKVVEWFYLINMHKGTPLRHRFLEIAEIVADKFETVLEFGPGFFRLQNHLLNKQILESWKDFLESLMEREDYQGIFFTNWDKEHSTANTIFLNFLGDQVYFSPFIYDQIVDTSELLRVKDLSAEGLFAQHMFLQKLGYQYAQKTQECSDCEHLVPCVGRNVLNVMQLHDTAECPFPHQLRPKYSL